jgi:hypothetical protein
LTQKKLNEYRLDEAPKDIKGYYYNGRHLLWSSVVLLDLQYDVSYHPSIYHHDISLYAYLSVYLSIIISVYLPTCYGHGTQGSRVTDKCCTPEPHPQPSALISCSSYSELSTSFSFQTY